MSDISPYGVTQNANAEMVTANELVGDRAGSIRENAVFGSAAGFSTAPYKPPPKVERVGRCHGKNDTCRAPLVYGGAWCIFHLPKDQGEPPAAP
jgi:hypothetical protein